MSPYKSKRWVMFFAILGGLLVLPLTCHAVDSVFVEGGNVDFSFYGKLVDQNNAPIANIAINYTYDVLKSFNGFHFLEPNPSTVTTDSQGCFLIQGHADTLHIQKPIEVPGYEYSYEANPKTSFDFVSTHPREHFVADQSSPFIFTLRKKGIPAYLLERKIEIMEDVTNDIIKASYLLNPYVDPNGSPGYLPRGEKPTAYQDRHVRHGEKDLLIEGSLSADGTQYNLEFSPLVSDSGVILSDQLLYEAPESGYQPSAHISVSTDTIELKKYLYVKLENGKFYGRLDVDISVDPPSSPSHPQISIYIDTWINPSGSRNLEYDEAYQFDERRWRELLSGLRGRKDNFEKIDTLYKKESTEFVKEFGLRYLPAFKNADQFLNDLYQLRAEKDAQNPKWWHRLEK